MQIRKRRVLKETRTSELKARVKDDLKEQVKEYCRKNKMTMSDLIVNSITVFIKK